jgi:nucleotidyltransferase substrate binding protein (TIGR01987 family)
MSVDQIELATDNLERALSRLDEALAEPLENRLAVDATIQRFEFTFELLWKAVKRFLEYEGLEAGTPRGVLQQAYQLGWLENEDAWLQMLRDRNQTSHTYNEATAREIYHHIRANAPELHRAQHFLRDRLASIVRAAAPSGKTD